MNCYLVVADLKQESVRQAFPEQFPVTDSAWVVAGRESTCAEVCEKLGISPEPGMVCKIGDYYGYHDRALWDKIKAWQEVS